MMLRSSGGSTRSRSGVDGSGRRCSGFDLSAVDRFGQVDGDLAGVGVGGGMFASGCGKVGIPFAGVAIV